MPSKNAIVLGRKIGTYNGWSELDSGGFMLFDFEPAQEVDLPQTNTLGVLYEFGIFVTYDSNGNHSWRADIIDSIKHLPTYKADTK